MSTATNGWEIPKGNGREGRSYNFQIKLCEKRSALSGCPVVDERNISKSGKFRNFLLPELWLLFRVPGNLLGKTPIFQALRYWKILFSPADFEPTSVRNCQFLTPPVRNCQHAVPEQVLGLEQSEQHGCPQGWTRGESQNTSPRVKRHLCPCASCKRGRCSSSQNAFEVCNFSEQKISLCMQ